MANQWLKDHAEVCSMVKEIRERIEERDQVLRRSEDVTRLVSSARRRIKVLGAKIERLGAALAQVNDVDSL